MRFVACLKAFASDGLAVNIRCTNAFCSYWSGGLALKQWLFVIMTSSHVHVDAGDSEAVWVAQHLLVSMGIL